MNLKKKIELLAPAGSMDALIAAVENGADAVYLALKRFGARAFAANFSHDELLEALKYAHLRDVKVYVTLNTMLYEQEITNVLKEVDFLYDNGVDGLIVSDIGLIDILRNCYPDIEIHVSTQAHIHDLKGAMKMKELGVDRIVIARESDLDTIRAISSLDIDTEVFVHGALCVSYSGQCLMGSILHQRSGNRGICSQCCRMRYRLHDKTKDIDVKTDGQYLLSPKDLNLIDLVPDLIEAGVTSFKIEGRMKRSAYVALVTRTYREAIDAYYAKKEYKISERRLRDLKVLFNRGFTKGYQSEDEDIIGSKRPNHIGIEVGEVIDQKKDRIYIRFSEDIRQNDGLRIIDGDQEHGLVAKKIYKRDLLQNMAHKGEIVAFDYRDKIKKGSKVYLTSDEHLMKEILSKEPKKIPIDIYYEAKEGSRLYLRVDDGKNTIERYGPIMEKAQNRPTDKDTIIRQLSKLGDTIYEVREIKGELDEVFIPISKINELRREILSDLDQKRIDIKIRKRKGFIDYELHNDLHVPYIIEVSCEKQLQAAKNFKRLHAIYLTHDLDLARQYDDVYLINSNIESMNGPRLQDRSTISEFADLDEGKIAYYTLNIANSYSVAFYMAHGASALILSLEISDVFIESLLESFKERYGFIPPIYAYEYGKRDLMYFKRSPFERYENDDRLELIDMKGETFEIKNDKQKTYIQESKSTLLERSHTIGHYLRFTDESAGKVNEVIYRSLMMQDRKKD